MTTERYEINLLGRTETVEYSPQTVGYALFLMRVAMGWILFQGGIVKVLDPEWTAAGFLNNAIPAGNPLTGFWEQLAGSGMIDGLNAWGLTLVGLGLMLGALTRFNAFWGAVMMLFYWLASLEGGIDRLLPLEHGWIFDDHLLYAILLFGLGALGAGRVLGLDSRLEDTPIVQKNPWMKWLLG